VIVSPASKLLPPDSKRARSCSIPSSDWPPAHKHFDIAEKRLPASAFAITNRPDARLQAVADALARTRG
jgi:hypothetical protein